MLVPPLRGKEKKGRFSALGGIPSPGRTLLARSGAVGQGRRKTRNREQPKKRTGAENPEGPG